MSTAVGLDQIAAELCAVAATEGSTLFAGAGVGSRAGLPSWSEFVGLLADTAESYDPDTAALMRKRLETGSYLNALELYRICPLVPDGTRFQALAAPFGSGKYNAKPLRALVALPFNAIVTTNFDRSLHDAFAVARQRAAFPAELGDPSLKQAIYHWNDPYIARIHGRAEVPKTMVLDQTGYQRTELDLDYLEFLVHILTRTRCAFIGYSFVDPAIHRVLQVVDARVAAGFPLEHLAVLPASGTDLRERLAKYNIRVLIYDDADSHELLWRAIREALTRYRSGPTKRQAPFPPPLASAQRFLAASYARAGMAGRSVPLRGIISEGVALGLLAEGDGLTRLELAERMRRVIPMTSAEAERTVQPAVDHLIQDGILQESGRQLRIARPPTDRIGPDVDKLAISVANRMTVRFGVDPDARHRSAIREILEALVLSRGWDLAASIASAKRTDLFDLSPALEAALQRLGADVPAGRRAATRDAIRDLLERPSGEEARVLTSLARLSFGVEIALERGRSTFSHSLTLPERIYLDASVLLPAITPGHPYQPTYVAAIRRLQEAAKRAGLASRVLVLEPFLNEIVSHRANAIRLVDVGGLEDPNRLQRFIGFTRADYTNVFVGGYASLVGRSMNPLPFRQFLKEVAPYETETEAADFLLTQGMEPVSEKPLDPKERDLISAVDSQLYEAYVNDISSGREQKADILIHHEAQQLARLMREIESGARSVFVTADSRLRRLAQGETLGRVAPALFSHTGLLQLIDLLVGLDADDESLARLLWAVEARDERDALRGYFIDLALRRYDAAMAMSMPKLVQGIVEEAVSNASREGIQLAFPESGEGVKRTFELLDRFEDRFYELMAEEVRKRSR